MTEGISVIKEAINAYHSIIASPEFRELERLRSKARHEEEQALYHARQQEREKWQTVIADKDAENEQLRKQIAELQAQLEKQGKASE